VIVVHGGAGDLRAGDNAEAAKDGCLKAAQAGHAILSQGGSALDAVLAAVTVLEDDPQFNAGTGSVLNADGEVEMDASVMMGDLQCGAVAAVRGIKNPIQLARLVMQRTKHILLAADGAHRFAKEHGVTFVDPASMITEGAKKRFASTGTVGAVARDKQGSLAAATSTGGTTRKLPGRVGDTPLIGCGTYADDGAGACSCTGVGEAIIRLTLARSAIERLRHGEDPQAAASACVESFDRVKGVGGLILLDTQGRLGMAFSTDRMPRAWVKPDGTVGAGFD
jgi:beta-aspartyl-peptidase (threonine type)